jgi:hypothetical protein
MSSDAGLYGIRKPKTTPKETSSSASLAFTSTLSNLIANPTTSQQRGRARTTKARDDIFATHNKNTKKRAARDLEEDEKDMNGQVHKKDIGALDDPAALHRSKRKMEEKAKKYRAMKRGEYVPADDNETSEALIDFDQKWAEREGRGGSSSSSSDDDDDEDGARNEIIEYEDEYGRLRKGTRADAARMERKKLNQALGQEELDRMSARPSRPAELIYGDTVQTGAFAPDESVLTAMEELARKRDRSLTPPEKKHYEAGKEFRVRGVGFYGFPWDEEARGKAMGALEEERRETERVRRERDERRERRLREVEERRRLIGEKRAAKRAENFLEGLGASMEGPDG